MENDSQLVELSPNFMLAEFQKCMKEKCNNLNQGTNHGGFKRIHKFSDNPPMRRWSSILLSF